MRFFCGEELINDANLVVSSKQHMRRLYIRPEVGIPSRAILENSPTEIQAALARRLAAQS